LPYTFALKVFRCIACTGRFSGLFSIQFSASKSWLQMIDELNGENGSPVSQTAIFYALFSKSIYFDR